MSQYKSKLESKEMDWLCKAILNLKNKEEVYRFFEDICTISEIKALEQRFQVARMLKKKKTYSEIANITGASTATISRVNRCLNYGSDGYNIILERLNKELEKNIKE
ncbi:Trp operon repressor [Clostridium acetireducens DSM 10703]|jgi:TrpR-related protein YerC/YecD|uniref:Trp operon repressor n=1 Tax=Clostridium acetireducens DSM 10703 TaxID=1121290 RepID=A0A1E8EZ29_9CLOT|nr:YerC/YecD family TrpR-related protein [Clostridium acetireducens]OFI06237.1 Trp operon repressor [Clostridium acetireducens DSM 10703]